MQISTLTQKTKECINICLHITSLSYWIVCKSLIHFQKPLIQIMSSELCYGEQVRLLFLFDKNRAPLRALAMETKNYTIAINSAINLRVLHAFITCLLLKDVDNSLC